MLCATVIMVARNAVTPMTMRKIGNKMSFSELSGFGFFHGNGLFVENLWAARGGRGEGACAAAAAHGRRRRRAHLK